MYRSDLDTKHKGGALAAVAAVHVALALALMHLSGTVDLTEAQEALEVFDIVEVQPPPPKPPAPPPKQAQRPRPKEKEGGSAPKNIRSEATPVVAPKPVIEVPVQPTIAASETPRQGTAPTQGASDVAGPGTGAGGIGTGTGSGAGGSGTGGGGGGGPPAVPAALVREFSDRDYPRGILQNWPRGGRIFLRLRIEPDGRPSQCDVMRSFGDDTADQWTCRLMMERGAFRPARDANGRAVAAWFGYIRG
jgi:protein TonB